MTQYSLPVPLITLSQWDHTTRQLAIVAFPTVPLTKGWLVNVDLKLRVDCHLQIDLVQGMMDCLYAECKPCITDCVMAELEKLGQKYRVALKVAKVPPVWLIGWHANLKDELALWSVISGLRSTATMLWWLFSLNILLECMCGGNELGQLLQESWDKSWMLINSESAHNKTSSSWWPSIYMIGAATNTA